MANLENICPNRQREEVKIYHRRLVLIAIPIMALFAWIHVTLIGIGLVALTMIWSRQNQRLSGAIGEEFALGVPTACPGSLKSLPDEYTVFNQYIVPFGESIREIDFIVVGPNGIFVIEIKHHRGKISGKDTDNNWIQRKRSRAGYTYEQKIRNPVRQVKQGIHGLKQYLKTKGLKPWIQGIVVFTNPDCTLSLGNTTVPVLRLDGLATFIRNHRGTNPRFNRGPVVRALKTNPEERIKPPYPLHIRNFMRDFATPKDRVEDMMNYDIRAEMERQAKENPLIPIPWEPPAEAPAYQPATFRRPVLSVIENYRHLPANSRVVTREFTVYVRETEQEITVQDDK